MQIRNKSCECGKNPTLGKYLLSPTIYFAGGKGPERAGGLREITQPASGSVLLTLLCHASLSKSSFYTYFVTIIGNGQPKGSVDGKRHRSWGLVGVGGECVCSGFPSSEQAPSALGGRVAGTLVASLVVSDWAELKEKALRPLGADRAEAESSLRKHSINKDHKGIPKRGKWTSASVNKTMACKQKHARKANYKCTPRKKDQMSLESF